MAQRNPITVQSLSHMAESNLKERLNKICTLAFETNRNNSLFDLMKNNMTKSSIKQLCNVGVVKYVQENSRFVVDWNQYHKVKDQQRIIGDFQTELLFKVI